MIAGLLDGLTLEEAVRDERLFFQDYYSVLADEIAPQVLRSWSSGSCLASVCFVLSFNSCLTSTSKQKVCFSTVPESSI